MRWMRTTRMQHRDRQGNENSYPFKDSWFTCRRPDGTLRAMKHQVDAVGDIVGLRRAIDQGPFDAVIASSPENVQYASDVLIATQRSIRDRLALLVWPKGQDPSFVLCRVEEGYVRQESWVTDIRPYTEFVTSPIALAADVLKERGLARGRIGCELEHLPGKYLRELQSLLPDLRIEACDDVFKQVRMFKTPREIAIITGGFQGTERAIHATFSTVTVGEDERSLYRRLADNILLSGADDVAFNHINAGRNTGFPHASPSDYRVQPGDLVKCDSGGHYSSYLSNVGRTAKLGKPTTEEQETWRKLREIHHAVIDMLRPGNTGRTIFAAATKLHQKHGLPFPYAHNGHSIGLEVHERPMISPFEDIAYAPGMISTVETRVREAGERGLHMEDLVQITEQGPLLLSTAFDNERIFEI
jgi:Xaa-Pro aminopeptidase